LPPAASLCDARQVLGQMETSVRQGDWNAVARLTGVLSQLRLAGTHEELGEHRRDLQRVLVAARVGRAGLVVSLTRVRAAAGFLKSRALPEVPEN
jgi:hypothetical protein